MLQLRNSRRQRWSGAARHAERREVHACSGDRPTRLESLAAWTVVRD
jgi:hypothetical protein